MRFQQRLEMIDKLVCCFFFFMKLIKSEVMIVIIHFQVSFLQTFPHATLRPEYSSRTSCIVLPTENVDRVYSA